MRTRILPIFGSIIISLLILGGDCHESTSPEEENEVRAGDYYVDIYDEDRAFEGTTLFTDSHDENNLKVVEVDMQGDILWEYDVPQTWVVGQPVGFEAERLPNGNILLVLSRSGIYEIDRDGNLVWQHLDPDCSHDADRLPNGNTIYVFGNNDTKADACVKEVDARGSLVWSWYARDHYNVTPLDTITRGGWAHTNAVTRLDNGNTLVSLRNFNRSIIVNTQGDVVWEMDWENLYATGYPCKSDPHDPEIHSDNTLLCCLQWETPYEVVEIDRTSGQPVLEYHRENFRTCRDADRLPNGNILIVGVLTDLNESVIFEITENGDIVWQVRLYETPVGQRPGYFFKAQRLTSS